ncbi:MAG TPA: NIPSNAP family protein [Pirellulales bacterium]|nr:NIPSNAP family protein [Pirellulales bacterium]
MSRLIIVLATVVGIAAICHSLRAVEPAAAPEKAKAKGAGRVYGEWRIRVRPDKGKEYAGLIESKGLPLFRGAGGRMVGWWTTLIGDLYEQVTIWEYDDMAAFEAAAQKLGGDPRFAAFVSERDPLLAGEENRFLYMTDFARRPALPEPSKVMIHELHRIPLSRREAYLQYMRTDGLALLERNGFRPAGPWLANVGRLREVCYLFRFDSLREREELIAKFAGTADAKAYGDKINEFAEEVSTRVLLPAPFAHPTTGARP